MAARATTIELIMIYTMAYISEKRAGRRVFTGCLAERESA
jgi:hypothetical protein